MAQSLLANLIVFARTLRAAGALVRAEGVPDAIRALADVGLRRKSDVRHALRTVFICRHEDLTHFDEIFEQFWRVWPGTGGGRLPQPISIPRRARSTVRFLAPGTVSAAAAAGESSQTGEQVAVRTYSADGTWRKKDFSAFTPDDVARAKEAMAQLVWDPGMRPTRRWVAGTGPTIDLRRLLRVNAKHHGELLAIPHRVRRLRPRPLVLICDVSGSMEPYTRMLLLFAHAITRGERRVEVFVFSTRLTRVTRQFADARVDAVLAGVRDVVRDWAGGTRIGEAIRTFNSTWARRVLRRGPIVLLISDGWDLGDPSLLGQEIARLQRSSFRLIWLNPLLGSPGYEPLARGMHAALPFIDDFLPVHDMSSLEALARGLNELGEKRWN